MTPRKKLTDEQKKKLDNNDVPVVTLKKAMKAFEKGEIQEADRLFNLIKAEALKDSKRKK